MIAPNDFVAGEESAVIAAVEGRPAIPRDKPVLVAESGVRGNATLVQNVETLAHLALIARHGPRWFRQMGTDEDPGTFLATVSGCVVTPGVHEFPYGVPLGATLHAAGGPTRSRAVGARRRIPRCLGAARRRPAGHSANPAPVPRGARCRPGDRAAD